MKLTLGRLRCLIREVARSPADLTGEMGLIFQSNEWSMQMALVDLGRLQSAIQGDGSLDEEALDQAVVGGITASQEDVWRVNAAWAQHGYGPLLYRLAMQFATAQGSSLGPHSSGKTSRAAERVWKRFQTEPDVTVVNTGEPGLRGKAYQHVGEDYVELAKRYDSLGLPDELDNDVKYNVIGLVRSRT